MWVSPLRTAADPFPVRMRCGRLFCQSIVIQLTTLNFKTHAPIMPQVEAVLNCSSVIVCDNVCCVVFESKGTCTINFGVLSCILTATRMQKYLRYVQN